jgi:hypothetical protein
LIQLVLLLVFSIFWLTADEAEIEVGICHRHMRRVRLWAALGGCLIVASIGMIVAGVVLGTEYGYLLLTGIVLLLSAPAYMSLGGRLLSATRIEPRLIWIKDRHGVFGTGRDARRFSVLATWRVGGIRLTR